jgi:hypothetical protein
MPRRDPAKAVQVLDSMMEFFDGGSRWHRGELVSEDGTKRCVIGALRHIRATLRVRGDNTAYYLRRTVTPDCCLLFQMHPADDTDLMGYNDKVRELILEARAIAQAELDGTAEPEPDAARLHVADRDLTNRSSDDR